MVKGLCMDLKAAPTSVGPILSKADVPLQMQRLDLVAGDLDEDVVEVLSGEALLDFVGIAACDDFAGMEEENAVTDLLDVGHVVLRVHNFQNLAEWICGVGGEVPGGAQNAWESQSCDPIRVGDVTEGGRRAGRCSTRDGQQVGM